MALNSLTTEFSAYNRFFLNYLCDSCFRSSSKTGQNISLWATRLVRVYVREWDLALQLIGSVALVTGRDKQTPTEGLGRAPAWQRWQQCSQRRQLLPYRKERKHSAMPWLPNPWACFLCHLMRSYTVIESLHCLPCCLSFPLCRSLSLPLSLSLSSLSQIQLKWTSRSLFLPIPPSIHACWRTVDY